MCERGGCGDRLFMTRVCVRERGVCGDSDCVVVCSRREKRPYVSERALCLSLCGMSVLPAVEPDEDERVLLAGRGEGRGRKRRGERGGEKEEGRERRGRDRGGRSAEAHVCVSCVSCVCVMCVMCVCHVCHVCVSVCVLALAMKEQTAVVITLLEVSQNTQKHTTQTATLTLSHCPC